MFETPHYGVFLFSFMLSREIARTKPDIIIAIDAISCYIANTAKK